MVISQLQWVIIFHYNGLHYVTFPWDIDIMGCMYIIYMYCMEINRSSWLHSHGSSSNIPSYPQDLPIETPDFRRLIGGTSTHGLHAANAGHQDPTVLGGDLEKEHAGWAHGFGPENVGLIFPMIASHFS